MSTRVIRLTCSTLPITGRAGMPADGPIDCSVTLAIHAILGIENIVADCREIVLGVDALPVASHCPDSTISKHSP